MVDIQRKRLKHFNNTHVFFLRNFWKWAACQPTVAHQPPSAEDEVSVEKVLISSSLQ